MTYLVLNGKKLKPYEYMTFLDEEPIEDPVPEAEPLKETSEIPLL